MKELIEKFAKKMLDEKLDFLPVEESLQLTEAGVEYKTRFSYVVSIEELDEDLSNPREILDAAIEFYGVHGVEIGDDYDHFEEFTFGICPAPTYIDLLKLLEQ